jgi:hypothetical protein
MPSRLASHEHGERVPGQDGSLTDKMLATDGAKKSENSQNG